MNIIDSVICDKCGMEIDKNQVISKDYFHISHIGGYYSHWPGDMSKLEIDLCQDCAKTLFEDFARIKTP